MVVPSRRVRTSRAIRSLAKCWDTDGAGLSTWSAKSPTDISARTSAHRIWTRVASANIRNTSTTRSTWSSGSRGAHPIVSAFISR